MTSIFNLLRNRTQIAVPGAVYLGPFPDVDHDKFYVIAGISGNRILACSVLINSRINPFIQRRPRLLDLQVMIKASSYEFLSHDSFITAPALSKGS
jgi:hypothetical protein